LAKDKINQKNSFELGGFLDATKFNAFNNLTQEAAWKTLTNITNFNQKIFGLKIDNVCKQYQLLNNTGEDNNNQKISYDVNLDIMQQYDCSGLVFNGGIET